jgi:hypothetical protein
MQAPTTPTDPSATGPQERPCPGCGASNGPLAAFCWQCYRTFGPSPGVIPGRTTTYPGHAGGLRGAYASQALSPATVRTKRSLGSVAGAALVVLALGVGAFLFLQRGPAAELPGSFGGMTRVDLPELEAVVETVRDQTSVEGFDVDMGFYGAAGLPTAALAWVVGPDLPATEDAFAEFMGGFDSSVGAGSVDVARRTTWTEGGVRYECAPVVGEMPAKVCLWDTDGVLWMLLDLSGSNMEAAKGLAVVASEAAAG